MIEGCKVFDQSIKGEKTTMTTLEKLLQVNETGCLLVYQCFKGNCKIIAIDLSKQQALDADPKII